METLEGEIYGGLTIEVSIVSGGAEEGERSMPAANAPPDQEDLMVQSLVINVIFQRHPVQLTLSELVREIVIDPDDFAERDGVERAVRDLAKGGVVHRGEFVVPTQAAFHCRDLSIEG
jgi:hypothetical protein